MRLGIEDLEYFISSYNEEQDLKKKHILYLNLVEESLKLVNKIAGTIYPVPTSVSREDLVQVGAIGLLKAINTYQVTDKGSFKTYASKFIKGKILQYLRDKSNLVKAPRETFENVGVVKDYLESLPDDCNPSAKDIAIALNMQENKVQDILNLEHIKNIVSLDQKVYSTDGVETLADRLQSENDKDFESNFENKKIIEYALKKLPADERVAIYSYYIEGETKKSIAKELSVSQTQVARLIKRALNKMYDIMKNDLNYEEE